MTPEMSSQCTHTPSARYSDPNLSVAVKGLHRSRVPNQLTLTGGKMILCGVQSLEPHKKCLLWGLEASEGFKRGSEGDSWLLALKTEKLNGKECGLLTGHKSGFRLTTSKENNHRNSIRPIIRNKLGSGFFPRASKNTAQLTPCDISLRRPSTLNLARLSNLWLIESELTTCCLKLRSLWYF